MSDNNNDETGITQLLEDNDVFSEMDGNARGSIPTTPTPEMNQQYTAMMDVMAASIKLAITEAIQQSMAISGQREQLETNVRQGTKRLSTLASPSNDKIVYMRSDQKDFEFKMSTVGKGM